MSLSDMDVSNFVRNGVTGAGMPAFSFLGDRGILDVVAYLRILQGKTADVKIPGDAVAGRSLFFGSGQCSQCHMMHGEGGFIASDLSDYGSGIALERIRSAILEPDKAIRPTSEIVEVRTGSERVRGVLRSEDNFAIILQLEDGRYRRFAKNIPTEIHHTGHSLMPSNYKERLSTKDLDDLVSYLVRSASPIDPGAAKKNAGDAK
jgi:putative heme-binding domain-containing protein